MGKQNFITLQLFAISGILISILVSMVAFRQFSLFDSKADLSTAVEIAPPYLRFEKVSQSVKDGKKQISVEVLANTNGLAITGADVMVQFDPKVLSISEDAVQSTNAFAILHINSMSDNQVDLSVFSEKSRGEALVQTNADQEVAIATLTFDVIDQAVTITQLEFVATAGKLNDSNLVLDEDPRPEFPNDVLQSVQPAIISL